MKLSKLTYFSLASQYLIDLLNDMETILASDSRFLLGNWLLSAKKLATNSDERALYEWNARTQVTLWGKNYTLVVII
jgi:alpha-N-acetylglucosaminidase